MESKSKLKPVSVFSAISMIIAIVIGSGIFFKSNDILVKTGGSVWLGILVFCIGAFSIIFGSLTLTELAKRTTKDGGVIAYIHDFISPSMASGFGWFQTYVYFPTYAVCLSWFTANYVCLLFGHTSPSYEETLKVAIALMFIFFAFNVLSISLSEKFQTFSTIVKLIPLLSLTALALILGSHNPALPQGVQLVEKTNVGFGFLTALTTVVFAYEGWVVAINVTNRLKKPSRDIPLAFIIGPMIIFLAYILYFIGINLFLSPEYIMSVGSDYIKTIGEIIFGKYGSNIVLITVIIAMCGVLNGNIQLGMQGSRIMAEDKMIPKSEKIAKINKKTRHSYLSCLIYMLVSILYMPVHYLLVKFSIVATDICTVAVVLGYAFYIFLYVKVFAMRKNKILNSTFKGYICPVFATIGSLITLIAGLFIDPVVISIIFIFYLAIFMAGYLYYKKTHKANNN